MKYLQTHSKIRLWIPAFALMAGLAAACGAGGGYGGGNPSGPGGGGGNGSGGAPKELNSGDFGRGGSYTHRFATAGTFRYHCLHHSVMTGTVVVSDAALDTLVNVSIVSSTTPFPGATVKKGGRVHWTNNTSMVHTVTSN
jgi:hypothetical protein